jgi:hypothetical protein
MRLGGYRVNDDFTLLGSVFGRILHCAVPLVEEEKEAVERAKRCGVERGFL